MSVYAQYEGIDSNITYRTEAFDLWHYFCTYSTDSQIRCRVDLSGFVDEAVLKLAITASLKTIPVIGCSFGGGSRRPRWVDKNFNGNDIVHVVKAGKDAEADIVQCLSSRVNFASGPQLKLFVVRKQKDDTLCFVFSHMVCDAAGLKDYIYCVSQLYTQIKNEKPVIVPPFYPRGIDALFADMTLKEKLKISLSDYSGHKAPPQRGINLKVGNSVTAMEKRIISSEEFGELKHFAKSKGATMNDCLMALFARSFCKNTDTDKIAFPATMDLRKYIPLDRKFGISNLSSSCVCSISVQPKDTLADTMIQVSNQMNAYKSDKNILKTYLMWDLLTRIPWYILKNTYPKYVTRSSVSFTNTGIVDQQLLAFDGLDTTFVYITGPILPRPHLQISASTFNERCTLASNINGSEADKVFIRKLMDDMHM